jgi:hypothetical protein
MIASIKNCIALTSSVGMDFSPRGIRGPYAALLYRHRIDREASGISIVDQSWRPRDGVCASTDSRPKADFT